MNFVDIPSMDTINWIRKSDKSLVTPKIVYADLIYSGLYYSPEQMEICIDGRFYEMTRGILCISNRLSSKEMYSTIAHEWRHHWQFLHGVDLTSRYDWEEGCSDEEYDNILKRYFILNPHELDALRFEYKHSTVYPEWEQILYPLLHC